MRGCLNTCTLQSHSPSLLLESGGAFVYMCCCLMVKLTVAIAAGLTSQLGNIIIIMLGLGLTAGSKPLLLEQIRG